MNVEQKYEHYKDVKTSENYVSTKYSQLKICLLVFRVSHGVSPVTLPGGN